MKQAIKIPFGFIIVLLLSNLAAATSHENASSAVAPPCTVGLQHTFEYKSNRKFTRTVSKQVGELCVVGNSSFDKQWVLVKLIAADGREITSPDIQFPRIGKEWLSFPLVVGKEWQYAMRTRPQISANVKSYIDWYKVVSTDRITVRAGTFDTYKIKWEQRQGSGLGVRYFWYSPDAEYYVKHQYARDESTPSDFWVDIEDYELVSIRRPGIKAKQ